MGFKEIISRKNIKKCQENMKCAILFNSLRINSCGGSFIAEQSHLKDLQKT